MDYENLNNGKKKATKDSRLFTLLRMDTQLKEGYNAYT